MTVLAHGVDSDWLWGPKDEVVYYIRDGHSICSMRLADRKETVLLKLEIVDREYPSMLILSPTGEQLGIYFRSMFWTLDIATRRLKKWFHADHYFVAFDWNDAGVCYIDTLGTDRRRDARLMVNRLDGQPSFVVASGRFSHPNWLTKSQILVLRKNVELWTHDAQSGKGRVLYAPKSSR